MILGLRFSVLKIIKLTCLTSLVIVSLADVAQAHSELKEVAFQRADGVRFHNNVFLANGAGGVFVERPMTICLVAAASDATGALLRAAGRGCHDT